MRRPPAFLRTTWATWAACLALAGCAQLRAPEATELYEATLGGAQEVPAVATAASGRAELQYHRGTQVLRWTVHHEGLSGPLTGAHIHGPAGPGQNAPVLVPLAAGAPAASLAGQLRLTPEQANQLASGQWYVNLHTARHPSGEIRGQLRPRR